MSRSEGGQRENNQDGADTGDKRFLKRRFTVLARLSLLLMLGAPVLTFCGKLWELELLGTESV
jgi:hypothetical protein